jgi:hypothetical protein
VRPVGRALAAAALLGALAACGGPAGAPPPPIPAPADAPQVPAPSPDEAVCAAHRATADTVRGIARAVEQGPVLPAGVALFLLDARNRAAQGARDPELAAAQAELVAAIDDLDAQARALLPPDGNPARDAVQLDPTRVVAAVEAVERVCGTAP